MEKNRDSLKAVPENYCEAEIAHGGKVVRLDYTTKDYAGNNEELQKYCFVYLPYGYEETKKYNTLYLLHGGGGEMDVFFEGEGRSSRIKKLFDHMIENGDMEAAIVVTPTYYHIGNKEITMDYSVNQIEHFHQELLCDLIPAVEGRYATYAESTDLEGLKASREHRAYGGYSMGSLSTWCTFKNCLDYFSCFLPMSGDFWIDGNSDAKGAAELMERIYQKHGYAQNEVLVYAVTGDLDIAYERMKNQMEAVALYAKSYQFRTNDDSEGNICFRVEPEAIHDYKYMPLYFYNALPHFWRL